MPISPLPSSMRTKCCLLAAAAIAGLQCLHPGHALAAECAQKIGDVAVGGLNPVADVHSLASLAIPANTEQLAATCRARLYLHWVGWIVLSNQERAMLSERARQFGHVTLESDFYSSAVTGQTPLPLTRLPITTPGDIVNTVSNPKTAYTYYSFLAPYHVGPDEVLLNGFRDSCLSSAANATQVREWKGMADQYHATGVRTVSVVFSPNNWGTGQCQVSSAFSDPAWNAVKAIAVYGGGIAIDAPPYFFAGQDPAYQKFIEDEIAWAKAHKVHVTYIISPPPDDTVAASAFQTQTTTLIARLIQDSATPLALAPDEYAVESYNPFQNPADPTIPNAETAPDSITAVALWLAQNAPTTETPTP